MLRSILTVVALGALPGPQPGEAFTRLLDCQMPYAAARALAESLPVTKTSDRSTKDYNEVNVYHDPAGVTVLGMTVPFVAHSWFVAPGQFEYTFAARVNGDFATWRGMLLRHYNRTACTETASPDGDTVCGLHLRVDPGQEALDVDVQVAQSGDHVQFECIYSIFKHKAQ